MSAAQVVFVAVGTPEDVGRVQTSYTGQHLAAVLAASRNAAAMSDRS